MTDDEVIARAHRAYAELTETQAIFDRLRAALIETWAATGERTEQREKMFYAYSTINRVEKALREAVDAGKVATHAASMAELLRP